MGAEFKCECGWHMDRHINASINLLQTVISKGMAGGLRFSPGALYVAASPVFFAYFRKIKESHELALTIA